MSELDPLWHVEGDFNFFAWEMYMLIGKMLFLLFRPSSERLYKLCGLQKGNKSADTGLGGRLGREREKEGEGRVTEQG